MAKKKENKRIEDDVKRVIRQLEKILQNVFEENETTRLLRPTISGISLDITLEPSEDLDDAEFEQMFKDLDNKRLSFFDFIDEKKETSDFSKFKEILQEWIRKIDERKEDTDNDVDLEDFLEDFKDLHIDSIDIFDENTKPEKNKHEEKNEDKKKVKIIRELSNLERTIEIFKDNDKVYVTADFPSLKKEDFKIIPYSEEVRFEAKFGRKKIVKNLKLPVKIKPNSMNISYRNGIIDVEFERANHIRRKEKKGC
ncbi:MAG: hypothetical protein QXT63_02540 [Thermoplasmata archaeon]